MKNGIYRLELCLNNRVWFYWLLISEFKVKGKGFSVLRKPGFTKINSNLTKQVIFLKTDKMSFKLLLINHLL